jgi:hypothetical protein
MLATQRSPSTFLELAFSRSAELPSRAVAGWIDKAKVWLGVVDEEDILGEDAPRARLRINPRNRDGRPALEDFEPAPQHSLEDALDARDAGDLEQMRKLLEQMDHGRGLRTLLRAAAALEAADDNTLQKLLPRIRAEQPPWRVPLQLAVALDDDAERASALVERARERGAPAWALAWCDALSLDDERRRRGLVRLLFTDMALARTVAARDLEIEEVQDDVAASKRYVSFAHGRDCIRRFGANLIADVHDLAEGKA